MVSKPLLITLLAVAAAAGPAHSAENPPETWPHPERIASLTEDKQDEPPVLDSRLFHTFRDNLQNARIVFESKKEARVAFLGGSITANRGWRDSICTYLQHRFPQTDFDFINAGIPSMGSTPGAFRLERDVLSKGKVDLLFVEAAVNDRVNGYDSTARLLAMEGIVRHAREAMPAIGIVIMHFVDPDKMADYRKGSVPAEINDHERVAAHYNISTINLAEEVTRRIDNGEFSWENDFKDLHPSPFGQRMYYHSIRTFLEECFAGERRNLPVSGHILPPEMNEGCYDRGMLIPATRVKPAKGWTPVTVWTPSDKAPTRPDFTGVPMLIAGNPGKTLSFEFEGNAVGIAVAAGPDAGMIRYRVDHGEWKTLDLFTSWSRQLHLPWFYTLAHGLTPGKHRLQIRVVQEKNPKSTGNACRIRYFYVNQ